VYARGTTPEDVSAALKQMSQNLNYRAFKAETGASIDGVWDDHGMCLS